MGNKLNKNLYSFKKYCGEDRWSSYWHQIDEILELHPSSVLEIGVGDRVLSSYLKEHTNINYKSLDIEAELSPDFLGSVDNMADIGSNSFDLVCAFEVLEHLPFEKFGRILNELKRVSKRWVVISLPHWGRHFGFEVRLPFFEKVRWQIKFSICPMEHKFSGEHHWEIGKKGYGLNRIKQEMVNSGLKIKKDYVVFTSPYHHFFILEKE